MRFYKEFGIFLPKIQNKIKQKHKTKLDNFTKRIYIVNMKTYFRRMVDDELDLRLRSSGGVLIVGPKWCGKTTTAEQKAQSVVKMQDPDFRDS